MKLSLLYSVWTGDDMEMLKRSIEHHKPFVDEIIVCYQTVSNKGGLSCFTSEIGVIINDYTFTAFAYNPDLNLNTKENERIKHNRMIQAAKSMGATHFILCACDHFYTPETFENAKKMHLETDIDVSFTKMVTYYKHENWALWPLENYYMPFIHKMYPDTCISKTANYPVLVDPSVKVNTCRNSYVMDVKQGYFHHYSMIRKDIKKKFRNAASSIRWTEKQVNTFISEYENAKIGDKITYFQGAELIEVEKVLELINGL